METKGSLAGFPEAKDRALDELISDLRLRLHASQEEERAARAEIARLARELAVSRRLLALSYMADTPQRAAALRPGAGVPPRIPAVSLRRGAIFGLDACQSNGEVITLAGWAFVPVSTWDGSVATVTVLFRHADETYAAATARMPRGDVAAHFASQPAMASGGAEGLVGAGFACEVIEHSLPRGVPWEIVLRLECADIVSEQPVGRTLCL